MRVVQILARLSTSIQCSRLLPGSAIPVISSKAEGEHLLMLLLLQCAATPAVAHPLP